MAGISTAGPAIHQFNYLSRLQTITIHNMVFYSLWALQPYEHNVLGGCHIA